MRSIQICSICGLLLLLACTVPSYAQLVEPPVQKIPNPVTPHEVGVSNHLGGGIVLNNFGFGIKGVFGHVVGPFTEITFSTGITGIRYNSQQKVFDFSFSMVPENPLSINIIAPWGSHLWLALNIGFFQEQ